MLAAAGVKQPKLTDLNQAKLVAVTKKDLNNKWCLAFAATGTLPEVLCNRRWRDALTATNQHAKALEYKGPEYNSMREETLDRVVDDLQKKLDDMEKK